MKRRFLLACFFMMSIMNIIQASSTPTVSRVYGDQFVIQVNPTQSAASIGTIDISFGVAGHGYISPTNGSIAYSVQALSDGTIIVLSSTSGTSSSWVSKYNAEGTIISSFGTTGFLLLTGYSTVDFMTVDAQNRILVSGNDDKTVNHYPWIQRVTSAGANDTTFTFSDGASWTSSGQINQLGQQTNGKIIAVGYNGTNGMIARYNLNGTIDSTFGTTPSGYIILNGASSLPTSTDALYSIVIDANNNIYITYVSSLDSQVYVTRFTANGAIDATWNGGTPVNVAYFNSSTIALNGSELRMILNAADDLIIASTIGTSSPYDLAASSVVRSSATYPGTFGSVTLNTGVLAGYAYDFRNLMATSDGSVYFIASVSSPSNEMAVIRYSSAGVLDTTFNGTGVNFFYAGGTPPVTNAFLFGGSIAANGEIYVAGTQNSSTPYLFRLSNNQYVTQVAQFPATQEQGIQDLSFGTGSTEVYPGVVYTINGQYGASLMQQSQAVIEITTGTTPTPGDILIGMDGFTNTSPTSNMMFSWLTAAGALDTAVGNSGYLTLQNTTASNEYLLSLLQGQSGAVYAAGYASATPGGASTGAILRAYAAPFTLGIEQWSISSSDATTAGYQGLGVGIQTFSGSSRILLFVAESATVGHISGYTILGALDTSTFNSAGSIPGEISPTDFGLHMGPSYGGIVNIFDEIFVAYKDSLANTVTVAAFNSSGSGLVPAFGTSGVITGLFGGTTNVTANNIRICFDSDNNIIVGAVVGTGASTTLRFACIDSTTGALITTFGTGGILSVPFSSATVLQLEKITGVSDGTVVATFWDNAADDTMYVARIVATGISAGTLDTTFNSQGSVPGVLPIKIGDKVTDYYARVLTSALVQSTAGINQGNIVIAGYESLFSTDATPITMSVYGDPGSTEIPYYPIANTDIPGTFDTAYDLNSLFGIIGSGTSIFVYPVGNTYQGMVLIGIDTGTTSKIIRMNVSTQMLDTTFGTAGVYTISQGGVSSVSIDASNKVLVGGTTSGGTVWAQQLSPNGSSAILFTIPINLTNIHGIYQQESGRYIVAASGTQNNPVAATNIGILVAFQDKLVSPATTLVVDRTFNPLGVSAVTAGQCSVGLTAGLYAMAINNNAALNPDTIAVAYAVSGAVKLGVFTADGSGYSNTTFNIGGGGAPITTGVTADSSAVVQLNIDASGNMIVGASYNNGGTHQVQVQRYTSAGVADTGFNSGNAQTISNLGTSGVTLTDILETTTSQTVLVGYNTGGGNGPLFAARFDATGTLDATWNPSPSGTDTAGVLTYSADAATQMNDAAISINGTILSIGSTATGTAGHPILTLVYGDLYITQISQNPLEFPAGTLDLTIPNGNSGALPLATLPVSGSVSGVPQRLYIYNSTINSSPNGAMLMASTSGANLYVTQLNADLSLNTNFGSGTGSLTLTPNSGTSPVSVTVTSMYIANGTNDTTQPIYIAGYTTTGGGANSPFGVQVTFNGSSGTFVSPAFASAGSTIVTGSIRQSTNSRILISGFNGTNGVVVAYNSAMTAIDTSFGNAGYYTTSTANPIYTMTTDNSDRIYIAYQTSSSNINVQRLLENGTGLDTTFGTAGTFSMSGTNLSVTQIRMAIDFTNNQLVVAAQSGTSAGNNIQVNRYNISTNAATTAINTITISGAVITLSDLFMDNNQNIYVIGYISSGTGIGNSVVARVKNLTGTTISLDSTYATSSSPAGVANLAVGAMTQVKAAALDPDRRVYLVGSNGSTTAYMGRFFGDFYWTEIYPAILQALVGTIDLTLNPNFTGGLILSSLTGWSSLSSYVARAIIENPNGEGTSFIAFGNNTNLIVGKLNADMTPVTASFGSANGLTTSVAMNFVGSMTLDAAGNIIVAGFNAGAQKVVSFTSAGALNATFATPTLASITGTTVAQQKSGRYIVGGYDGTTGLISAYQNESAIVNPGSSGILPVDNTFGPAADNGYYPTGVNAQIDDLCINSNDEIYFVYTSGGTVFLGKLTANGSGLVNSQNSPTAFNGGAVVSTGITSASSAAHIAINSTGNILVGASTSSGVKTALYNGSTGAIIGSIQTVPTTVSSFYVLSKLVGSIAPTNEFYGSVNNQLTTTAIAFAITAAGVLDTSFGASLNGILSTTVQSPAEIDGISIQFDGKLVMVGRHITPSAAPILLRGYGYPYISQYAQAPDQIAAGILDTTLWPSTGAFVLNNTTNGTFNTAITGSTVKRVYESGNGLMTFVADNGTTTFVFQLLKDLTLNTAFNTVGYRTFATSYGGTTGLFVDSLGNIFITGNNGSASWTIGMTSTGANLSPAFSPTASLATANEVSQQSAGRVILGGQGSVARGQANTHGYLLGYTNTGALDVSFGTGGQVDMTVTTAITDITIDQFDNIIAVSNNSGSIVLQKVTPSGGTITTSSGTAITSASGNIKVAIDSNGYIIVAALTSTGYSVRSYLNNSTLSNNAGSAVTFGSGLTTPVLSNIYTTSSGKIFLVGYDAATTGSTPGYVIVGRLTSGTGTLTLDTSSFNAAGTSPSAPGYVVAGLGLMNQFFDAIIHADDRTMLVGGSTTSANPYMGRVFGDQYYTYVSQGSSQGVPGTLDTTFGTNGAFDLSTLSGVTANSMGEAIIALANGGYYMALQNASNTQLIKTLASGALDTSYGGANGIATSTAPLGVNSMLQDGLGKILLVGTTGGAGWVKRYTTAGVADSNFGTSGQIASGTVATVAIEQTLARLVVAGANGSNNGALFAYTSIDPFTVTTGALDTTFGNGTGSFSTGVAHPIYTLIADQYDRLIFASLNAANNAVDLYRLTPTGELDVTFGTSGKVAGVITSANSASQIRVALDLLGNIVVAASVSTPGIKVVSYNNGTSTTAGANGALYTNALNISFSAPTLTALVTSADGYVLVLGNQLGGSSATSPTWVARLVSTTPGVSGGTYVLDSTNFNPAGLIFNQSGSTSGGTAGIFEYTSTVGTTSPYNIYNAFTVNASGRLGVLGYERTGASTFTPTLLSVYDDPYTTQEAQSPDSKPVGTNDITLGVSPTFTADLGVIFFGASGNAASGQVARALALYDNNNNFVVALDGNATAGAGASDVMINMFDTDGIANPNFGTAGSATVLTTYQNQFVNDMVTFTTAAGVHKAIIAGYVYNSFLSSTDSLVMQYTLTPGSQALDTTFGGYNGNPQGVAFGDGQNAFVVGRQTLGRIIVGGETQDTSPLGLLLGYGTNGNLDTTFGNDGYLAVTGTSGIYTHAIDTNNMIVIAYVDGSGNGYVARFLADGSALDSTFNSGSPILFTAGVVGHNVKVAVDSSNNVIVAAITASGNSVVLHSYDATSGSSISTATFTGSVLGNASAVYTIGRLLIDLDSKVVVVASDSNIPNILVARMIASGGAYVLDTQANDGTSPFNGTFGYKTYAVAGGTVNQVATSALIHPDGRIIIAGSED